MLAWIGLALLSVAWLPGLGYYHAADRLTWAALAIAGTALLGARPIRMPSRPALLAALAMIVPAVWIMPWPYRAAPVLLAVGMVLGLTSQSRRAEGRWMNAATGVFLRAGGVLLAQSLAMISYAVATSQCHLLPSPLPRIIAAAVKALGIDAGVNGTTVAVFSMRTNHLFTATWELLLDPPTWCFLIGGTVLLCWNSRIDLPKTGMDATAKRPWFAAAVKLWVLVALWLPFRAALLIAIYLDCVLRTDYDAPLDAMKLFWSTWVLLAMLAGPVLLAWRFVSGTVRWTSESVPEETKPGRPSILSVGDWRYPTSTALAFAAVGLACLGLFWDLAGKRKEGRVLIEELQGDRPVWERTDKPYDTEWYGNMSGYNYYSIFNYYGHFYDVARLAMPIDDEVLKKCDVLILKIPTREYSDAEVDAVVRFVKRGGGLMLIGEHTDVFGSGTYLNKVAKHFGFSYRFDCLFGLDSVFKEHYDIPLVPHPILQYMPTFDFAISCSIDPGTSGGRAVIRNAGLKNLMADYHADNFYPRPDDSAEMEYGSFTQLLAVRYGKGRVAAFSDSTVFSNFCTFEPGKAELMMGMLEWLNHQGGSNYSREWLLGAAAVLLCIAVWLARGWNAAWLMFAAAGLLGWSTAVWGSNTIHRYEMPRPTTKPDRPLVQFVIDRTLCDGPLSDAGFVQGKENGFGIFERWILRLGYFTGRRGEDDPAYFDGNALALMCPHHSLPPGYRERLAEYVRGGGRLLVLDSADRAVIGQASDPLTAAPSAAIPPVFDMRSTAGDVLEPFGLSIDVTAPVSGTLDSHGKWPAVPINRAAVVSGGQPFAWVEGRPVATTCVFGKGSVTVLGFANRFSDANMGVTGDVEPDDGLKAVYAVQFGLLGEMMDNKLTGGSNNGEKAPSDGVKQR